MKKFQGFAGVCLYAILAASCTVHTANTKNDLRPDKEAVAAVAGNIPLADPFILFHDNTYYAYGTSSDEGFDVFYSKDLKAWTKHKDMLLKKADSYGSKWFWAPEVYRNPATGKFYLFYSAEEHICVATADSPLGPFKQDTKKPMRDEKGIDSSLFIDEDGTPYIYFVRFTNGNEIWVAKLEDDWQTIKEETLTKCITASQSWETVLGKVTEGASVLKYNSRYYMLYSGNDFRSKDYGLGYATASSPMGPWIKNEHNPVLQRPATGLVGTGHGAYFKDKNKDYKYVFHAHHDTSKVSPRLMYILNMEVSDDKITFDKNSIVSPYTVK